jgi:urease accessory protein
MQRDAAKMRDNGPTIFTSVKLGSGVDQVVQLILRAWSEASGQPVRPEESASVDSGKTGLT